MYTNNMTQNITLNSGIATYKNFREVYKLEVIQRQSGESEAQKSFRDILLRLREGDSTIEDWKILATRFEDKLSRIERDRFSDATFILSKWNDVDRVNIEKLTSLNRLVAKIQAIHTGGSEAKRADSDVANGLESLLLLAKGSRVMLTANL